MVDEVKQDVFYTLDEQQRYQSIEVMFNNDGTVIIKDYDNDSVLLSEAAALNLQQLLNRRHPPNGHCPICNADIQLIC